MKKLLLRAAPFAAGIALMSAGAFADTPDFTEVHNKVVPGTVQAGPMCGKVGLVGVPNPGYAFDKSRVDIQNIILRHAEDGTDLYYQLAGSLPCSEGSQALRQIIWAN